MSPGTEVEETTHQVSPGTEVEETTQHVSPGTEVEETTHHVSPGTEVEEMDVVPNPCLPRMVRLTLRAEICP